MKARLEADDRVSEVLDLPTPEITYPEVSFRAAQTIVDHRADRGVLICGTGIGTAIAANKVAGVRAATAHDLVTVRGAVAGPRTTARSIARVMSFIGHR